jgi:putative ABC transport system substrate-binding protein
VKRREFIALLGGAALSAPVAARAQQALPVIGYLDSTSPDTRKHIVSALWQGLNEAGFVEGRNVAIEYRFAENQNDRLPALAAELVQRQVAVIVGSAIRATLAAKAATSRIPIVFATANDPVQFGLVASLNRPGGNITGTTWLTAALGEKRLELLHQLVPAATSVALLVNPSNANAEGNIKNAQAAALALGLRTHVVRAASEDEVDEALAEASRQRVGALLVLNDPLFNDQRSRLVAALARRSLPAIYPSRDIVEEGGLMSYGASVADAHRQAGIYTGRILKGEKPTDLPVQQETKVELIINLKTAKALGITVPLALLGRADEVIE